MLCAVVPRDPADPIPKPALGITHATDIDALADSLLRWAEANEFLGGAFPFYCVYLFDVYNLTAELLGGEVEECGDSHFAEFALPYLCREFARLDGVCYHLDGLGNLPNLDVLCQEPNLHLIQWVPGAGHERDDWTGLSERIDELAKGMMRGGTVASFEQWYDKHKAPWQYWSIYPKSPAEFSTCLRNLGV